VSALNSGEAPRARPLALREQLEHSLGDSAKINAPHVDGIRRQLRLPWAWCPIAAQRAGVGLSGRRTPHQHATIDRYSSAAVRALPLRLSGLVAIEPVIHGDGRGFFTETYRREWHEQAGIPPDQQFLQDNHSRSARGVVRGMHFHVGDGVAKLVRCARGRILDVAVDLRRGSPTYGQWEGVELDEQSMRTLYVPVGFAHGFCVLSVVADVLYKQTAYYDPAVERGIVWNDPDVGIEWPLPVEELTVSERDAAAPRLRDIEQELPFTWPS
jgi:dTDP-4-dehydrorhamnose 3,5-epimerase